MAWILNFIRRAAGERIARVSVFILLAGLLNPIYAQNVDVVKFKDGDRLAVSIIEFGDGRLRVSKSGIGAFSIDWDAVESVETNKTFQVELSSGERLFGTLSRANVGDGIVVSNDADSREISFEQIAKIQRVKRGESFWKRIDGSVRLGMNYTSGSEVGQVSFGLNLQFNELDYIVTSELTGTRTTGSATNDTQRFNWGVNYYRILDNRWFWTLNSDLDRNDELGIDLRLLGGGGVGRFLIKNNRTRLGLSAGLAASRERRATDADENQVEGQLLADYSFYFFDARSTDAHFNLALYPGITESDRLRGNFDAILRWELIEDLFWDLTYFYTWDNQPPVGAAEEDTGITTSIGYTF